MILFLHNIRSHLLSNGFWPWTIIDKKMTACSSTDMSIEFSSRFHFLRYVHSMVNTSGIILILSNILTRLPFRYFSTLSRPIKILLCIFCVGSSVSVAYEKSATLKNSWLRCLLRWFCSATSLALFRSFLSSCTM